LDVITGVPTDNASSMGIPNPSNIDGYRKMSADLYIAGRSSVGT